MIDVEGTPLDVVPTSCYLDDMLRAGGPVIVQLLPDVGIAPYM